MSRSTSAFFTPNVDLSNHPRVENQTDLYPNITIGDLHASPLKMLFFLVRYGVFDIDTPNWSNFTENYEKYSHTYRGENNTYQKTFLNDFKTTLNNIKKNPASPVKLIRFLGDMLCDRGQNDYFILTLLKKVCLESDAKVEIIFSNHDESFVKYIEDGRVKTAYVNIIPEQVRSLLALISNITNGDIEYKDMFALYNSYYLPNLRLLSYSVENGKLNIFMHGVNSIDIIPELADELEIPYKRNTVFDSIKETTDLINAINRQFFTLIQNEDVSSTIEKSRTNQVNGGALYRLIWSREAVTPMINPAYEYMITHGHDHEQANTYRSVSLDSDLAKEGETMIIIEDTLPSRGSSSSLPSLENPEYYFADQKEFDLNHHRVISDEDEDADDERSSNNDDIDSENDNDEGSDKENDDDNFDGAEMDDSDDDDDSSSSSSDDDDYNAKMENANPDNDDEDQIMKELRQDHIYYEGSTYQPLFSFEASNLLWSIETTDDVIDLNKDQNFKY